MERANKIERRKKKFKAESKRRQDEILAAKARAAGLILPERRTDL